MFLPAALATISLLYLVGALDTRRDPVVADRIGPATPPRRTARWVRSRVRRVGASAPLRALALDERLARALRVSGWRMSAEELVGWKAFGGLGGALVGLAMPPPGPLLSPLFALVGFRMCDIALRRAVKRRTAAADAEVPQLLDLLAAGLSAGLAAPLALARSAEAVRGPLAEELRASLRAVELGRRWRDELAALSSKLGSPDLHRLVAMLSRTETLGSPLATSILDLASQVRRARAVATAERARKAPVKMLFPLVFLVLPAFLLLTVVPVLLSTLRAIR